MDTTKNVYDLLPSFLLKDIFLSKEKTNSMVPKNVNELSDNSSVSTTEGLPLENINKYVVRGNKEYDAGNSASTCSYYPLCGNLQQEMNCSNHVESPLTWMNTFQNVHCDYYLTSLTSLLPDILKTKHGSEMCSQLIDGITSDYFNELLNILLSHWAVLMCNSFAHPFCVKFFKLCNKNQKICLLNSIKKDFSPLTVTFFGSLSVQEMINLINRDFELSTIILECLGSSNEILMLCYHTFGCHVIQKVIQCISEEHRTKLNSVLLSNFASLTMHANGAQIIRQFIHHCKIDVNKAQISKIITKEFLKFSQNQYGNYLVQEFIESEINDKKGLVKNLMKKYFVKLATHRVSSYVIEKFLLVSKERDIKNIFQRLKQEDKLDTLAQNKYGLIILSKMLNGFHCEMM